LQANLLSGYDETGNGSNGAPSGDDAHGTNVSGIIAAIENNIGIVGVAPQCKIIPIRIAYEDAYHNWVTNDVQIASGFAHAWFNAQADVISCSWGGGSPSTTITNAINDAVNNGRNSKGCPVVFAAGNYNSIVFYPASLPNVIAVGALSMCNERKRSSSDYNDLSQWVDPDPEGVTCDGEKWWGSDYGANLDVSAPGVKIYTTDIQGTAGYNNSSGTSGNYFDSFNGTSAATPFVSGIAALILSVRPDLTQAQVRQAIESTCTKLPDYSFSNNSNQPNGTWNDQVGYGRVNAYTAVYSVEPPPYLTGPSLVCYSAEGTFTVNNLYTGATIIWQYDTNLLAMVSAQGSNPCYFRATGSGNAWVRADIHIGDLVYTMPQVLCSAGTPTIMSIYGPTYVQSGTYYNTYYAYAEKDCWNFGTNYYFWSIGTSTSDNWTYISFDNSGHYTLEVTACNPCGCGNSATLEIDVYDGYRLTFSPNPSTDETTVSVESTSKESIDANLEWNLEVYDQGRQLKAMKTKLKGKESKLNTSGWREGVYIVLAKIKGQTITGKLIVN
jgi:hypothetical protein